MFEINMLAYCLSIQRGIAVRLHAQNRLFKRFLLDRFPALYDSKSIQIIQPYRYCRLCLNNRKTPTAFLYRQFVRKINLAVSCMTVIRPPGIAVMKL